MAQNFFQITGVLPLKIVVDDLSKIYIDSKTPLLWECAEGHRWETPPDYITNDKNGGTWCPYCIGRYKTIKDMQEIAKSKGGKCLSKEYISGTTRLIWECAEGHRWKAIPANIINKGTWCPVCSGKTRGVKLI